MVTGSQLPENAPPPDAARAADESAPPEPARRRATYTPPVPRRAPNSGLIPQADMQADTHSDDELAQALEQEVLRLTSAIPIIIPSVASSTDTSDGPEPASQPTPEPEPEDQRASGSIGTLTTGTIEIVPNPTTGAHPIVGIEIDPDLPDDADDLTHPSAATLVPLATPRVGVEEDVLYDAQYLRSPLLSIEPAGSEPTPLDYRVGRAARMFWLWFAATASAITIGLGGVLIRLGLGIVQAVVAVLVGLALSFVPLGLATLSGKWSGQPTVIVSRAMFGLLGNVPAAVLAVITRVFWGAGLLWLLAVSTGGVVESAYPDADAGVATWLAVGTGGAVAVMLAVFGYSLIARIQLVLTIASAALIVAVIVVTAPHVRLGTVLAKPLDSWLPVVTGAVLVFSVFGIAWANAAGDLARYQRPGSSGSAAMLWTTFGAALPVFILAIWGAVLAASDPDIAAGLATNPIGELARLSSLDWFPPVLFAAIGLSLVSAVVLNLYSSGFAVQALIPRAERWVGVVAAAVLTAVVTIALVTLIPNLDLLLLDAATTLAVPVAVWAGVFSAEMMLRRRRFTPDSLLRRGGVYPDWRWPNLAMLFIGTAIGFGFMHADIAWLSWEGFLFRAIGINPVGEFGTSDIGVLIALGLGLVTPIATGIREIRRQESASR